MKRIIEENEGQGMEGLLGEDVLIFAMNYIYTGKLSGVNETCVELTGAKIVYETGPFTDSGYKDAQALPGGVFYIQTGAIESFGRSK